MTPRPLTTGVAGTLALLSALHMTRASSSWSLPDRSRFTKAVIGTGPDRMSSAAATSAVAGLLAGASLLVVHCAAPGHRRPSGRVATLGTRTVAGVLVARAVAGLVVAGSALVDAPSTLRRFDLTVHSPLCLLLDVGAADLVATAHRTDP